MGIDEVDVVVVGGGAMGSAAAWQLTRRGVTVLLLEQYEEGHTRGASHGASRIFRLTYPDAVHIGLAREAQRLWRELEDESGAGLLTVTGGVDHGDHPYLDQLADGLTAAGVAYEWLEPAAAAERWPGIRFDTRALFHPDSGRLHADRSVAALQAAARDRGAVVRHDTPVTAIEVVGEDAVLVHTGSGSYRARRVVAAVNAWAAELVGALVPLPPLRVTQEQPAHFAALEPEAGWPSFGHLSAGVTVYGLATPGEGIKAGFHGTGPEVDPDHRDFRPEPTQLAALRDYARKWLPGVDSDVCVPISCTYTTTPTSTFVLDRRGPVVVATGFSGHGFKFVPAIGRVLADLAIDGSRPDSRFSSHS
ncbi:N-methyltryptophan oxidase [Paractinoplanes abujensis]|uniref:Sarcosine oxidase n=1 Tax=Paractinoplanes abujensis TaxID=882441 RepID=A0A7W7CQ20_9ACTN|nr:FAD-dependent oxidoreductase [Actinoplanes abujensis]MBB4692626.1 sarcosine oxidase [Actinoplanes abujensis]GID22873.1 N-methyltryptophan oxidase [Actinoplanes abujensis]